MLGGVGRNWLVGARLIDNSTMLDTGLELVDSCWNSYASTQYAFFRAGKLWLFDCLMRTRYGRTHLGPDAIAFIGSDGGNFTGGPPPSTADMEFYNNSGFYMR